MSDTLSENAIKMKWRAMTKGDTVERGTKKHTNKEYSLSTMANSKYWQSNNNRHLMDWNQYNNIIIIFLLATGRWINVLNLLNFYSERDHLIRLVLSGCWRIIEKCNVSVQLWGSISEVKSHIFWSVTRYHIKKNHNFHFMAVGKLSRCNHNSDYLFHYM